MDLQIGGIAAGGDDAYAGKEELAGYLPANRKDVPKLIAELEKEMNAKADDLDFEGAAVVRDKIQAIKDLDLGIMPKNAQALKAEARAAAGIAPRPKFEGKKRGRGNGSGKPGVRK